MVDMLEPKMNDQAINLSQIYPFLLDFETNEFLSRESQALYNALDVFTQRSRTQMSRRRCF